MTIAIIGAGVAGLMAAYTLHQTSATEIVIFEKSRGVAGRVATRWYDRPAGRVYVDHGAQYIKAAGEAFSQLMLHTLDRADLTDIRRPVWVFDARNRILEGDAIQNSEPKWSYRAGLTALGRLIVKHGGLKVQTEVRVAALRQNADGYKLTDTEGRDLGTFEQIVIAIPAGQAAELVAASALPPAEQLRLEAALRAVVYRRCITAVLGYERALSERPYYALVNTDRAHPISWVGAEHAKPGHVPNGHGVWVVQMAGQFSADHWDDEKDMLIQHVVGLAEGLLGQEVAAPDWTDIQKWRYSLPDVLADDKALNRVLPGLWFAGDYLQGGRVHLAAQTGYATALAMTQEG